MEAFKPGCIIEGDLLIYRDTIIDRFHVLFVCVVHLQIMIIPTTCIYTCTCT